MHHPFVRLIDLCGLDHLDVGCDVARGAEIDHFLRFGNSTNDGAG
jgi:hypothetical protein